MALGLKGFPPVRFVLENESCHTVALAASVSVQRFWTADLLYDIYYKHTIKSVVTVCV